MPRTKRYSPVGVGWKWSTYGLIALCVIGLVVTALIGTFVATKIHLIPGIDHLIITGKHRRPVDGVVKLIEQLFPSYPPALNDNSLVSIYHLQIKPKEIARIDDELVFFEKNFATLTKHELNTRRNWHDAKFLSGLYRNDVKVSLRGSRGHWLREKKSWRIKFPREDRFNGMRRTHLILPGDRAWVSDHLFNLLAKDHGLMVLQDGFAAVYINGIYQGLYYQIEHPDDGFLARYNRQSGPLLNDDPFWGKPVAYWEASFVSYINVPKQLLMDVNRFLGLSQRNVLTISEVQKRVDVNKYVTMSALVRLFGTDHWSVPSNMRLYHDPTSGHLEPIPWDTNSFRYELNHSGEGLDPSSTDGISKTLLADHELQLRRNKLLWKLVGPNFTDILDQYDTIAEQIIPYINADNMKVYSSYHSRWEINERYRQNLIQNASYFRNLLAINDVSVNLFNNKGKIFGDLVNWGYTPVGLIGISDGKEYHDLTLQDTLKFNSYRNNALEVEGVKQTIHLDEKFAKNLNSENIQLHLINLLTRDSFTSEVTIQAPVNTYVLDMNTPDRIPPGIHYESGQWHWGPGEINLVDPVISPSHTPHRIKAGTTINFSDGSFFVSRGQIIAEGTTDSTIMIKLPDSTGVMLIADAPDTSILRHVRLIGGGDMGHDGLWLTGALSFFRSAVTIDSCIFLGTNAEDALNIKNAPFVDINRSGFINSKSDALDLDWSFGSIRNSWFLNSGSDHIDLSGSEVNIEGNYLAKASDKGISVGEQSKTTIMTNAMVADSIGVAIKDHSNAVLQDNYFSKNKTAISLYVKKSYFKPPVAVLKDNYFFNNEKPWIVIDGKLTGEDSNKYNSHTTANNESANFKPSGWYEMQGMTLFLDLELPSME